MKYLLTGDLEPTLTNFLEPNDLNASDKGANLEIINLDDTTHYCGKDRYGNDQWFPIVKNPDYIAKVRKYNPY